MAIGQTRGVARQLARLFHFGATGGLSEGQLLDRYAVTRDEAAFEAIVARHGPMVWNVCRQVLENPTDVEDAFQATFLVLVKKAGMIRDQSRLGPWLHGVAFRISAKARLDSFKRKVHEARSAVCTDDHMSEASSDRETLALVHKEIESLSAHYRSAVVLCLLEGLTHEQAADRLGWPLGTVKGRLARAKDVLRTRLARRGIVGASALAAVSSTSEALAIPEALLVSTVGAAMSYCSGLKAAAVAGSMVSASAAALAEGALKTMIATKLKFAAAVLLGTGLVAGSSALAYQFGGLGGPASGQGNRSRLLASASETSSPETTLRKGVEEAAATSPRRVRSPPSPHSRRVNE